MLLLIPSIVNIIDDNFTIFLLIILHSIILSDIIIAAGDLFV